MGTIKEMSTKNQTIIAENERLVAKMAQMTSSYAAENSSKESKLRELKQKLLETGKQLEAATANHNQSEKEIEECLEEMERMRKGYEGDAVELFNVKQSKEEQDKKMQ